MLIYLDMCSLQRPFDDKRQLRELIEADAVLGIIALCESGQAELVSSEALDFENGRNPHLDRRTYVREVLDQAGRYVQLSPEIEDRARALRDAGIKPLDALHLACAIESRADYFCTCDDRLLKRARVIHAGPPKVVSPLELIAEIGP
jgi:predicted nucleic acid-binding protein